MKTEDLIVDLARSARPVTPLAGPSARFARWAAAGVAFASAAVMTIGPRASVALDAERPAFLALAAVTLLTSLLAAASAFVLSVPGRERSPLVRALPLVAAAAWLTLLAGLLVRGGDATARLAALPIHWGCIANIFGISLIPGLVLFAMVRRAAPLRLGWSAMLAALASLSLAAAAVQFICPIDDPAHHLDGHLLPVAVLAGIGALLGRRYLKGVDGVGDGVGDGGDGVRS